MLWLYHQPPKVIQGAQQEKCPFQQASMSTTLPGMVQSRPKRQNTKDQSWEVNSQWRSKWSTNNTFLAQNFLLQRLSIVKILPFAAVHLKESNFGRNVYSQHTLPLERTWAALRKTIIIRSPQKSCSLMEANLSYQFHPHQSCKNK